MIPATQEPIKLWGGIEGRLSGWPVPVQIAYVVEGRKGPLALRMADWRQIENRIQADRRRGGKLNYGKGWHPSRIHRFNRPIEIEGGAAIEYRFRLSTGDPGAPGELRLIFCSPLFHAIAAARP
jgi:hypothetical protein